MTDFDLGIEPLPEGIVAELESRFDQRGILLDREARIGFEIAEDPALALGHGLIAKLFRCDFIAPLAESAFGELLDVALVHQRDRLALILDGILNGDAHQPLGAGDGDGLDADAGVRADLFLAAHVVVQEVDQLLRLGRAFAELDAGVDVLGVLAEDHDVELLRMLHRAGHAAVVLHRPDAGVEIEHLAQRDIQRADAAAYRRGQRPFDGDAQITRGIYGIVGQPVLELAIRLLAGEDFEPLDAALAAIGLLRPRRQRRAARRARYRGRCHRPRYRG